MSYLTDPNKQFSLRNGSPNVAGIVKVFHAGTDDHAKTYCDFNGTRNPQDIRLDNNGRAVIIADASKAYRIEVCNRFGGLLWTVEPTYCIGGGGGGGTPVAIDSDCLIANKYDTHYVSGTDAGTGLSDGDFLFSERAKTGEDIWIGDDHKIYCKKGWYHFDFTTLIFVNPIDYTHNGGTQPRIDTIHLSAGGYGASVDADLDRCATSVYKTSVHISGDFYASSVGYNVGANITGLGYNAYAYVDKMCVHKVSED